MSKVILGCHSEHSIKESPTKIKDLCRKAKELNYDAVALCDHNTCTGWVEFLNECKAQGLNGIPGVEYDLKLNSGIMTRITVLAKNYSGFRSISKAVTKACEALKRGEDAPYMTEEILYGMSDVVVLTGGENGIFAGILLENEKAEEKVKELNSRLDELSGPEDEDYLSNVEKIAQLDEQIARNTVLRDSLAKKAKTSFQKREKGLEAMKGDPEYESAKRKLEEDKKESENAAVRLEEVKKQIKEDRRVKTIVQKKVKEAEADHPEYLMIEEEIAISTPKTPEEIKEEVYRQANKLFETFGGDFYIQLSYHGSETEKRIMPFLNDFAKKNGIKTAASNDPYITDEERGAAMQIMQSVDALKWVEEVDTQYRMKNVSELRDALCEIINEADAKRAVLATREIAGKCSVKLPDEAHYPKYRDENGVIVKDSAKLLKDTVKNNIPVRFPKGGFTKEYKDRAKYELQVITELGYCDYLLIVMDFIKYGRQIAKDNPEHAGYGVGPGRGSGAGSLVNYMIGITEIDPMKHGLLFERFLNKDRVSMPDIDTDFSKEIRDDVVQYVKNKYGEDSVSIIRTALTQGAKGSIKNCARVTGYEKMAGVTSRNKIDDIRSEFLDLGDKISKALPNKTDLKLKDCEEELSEFYDNEDAKKVIERAKSTENIMTGLGIHAAGVIIGDGNPLSDYIPLTYFKSKQEWAVQCDKEESEEIGLLKMDFLGLINLDIMSESLRGIKKHYNIDLDLSNLPQEKIIYEQIFANGNSDCVFQFESEGMKKMLKSFKPKRFSDIVLLVAAYRPGPMNSIPDIIAVKDGKKDPDYELPLLENILKDTYGCTVYQEQLMEIFHSCAGFTLGESDIIRRYMSKKKVDKFLSYKQQFTDGCIAHGATAEGADQLWDKLTGFAEYAFNKSHAAAYAMISYQTAFLKFYYPQEYMCAVLNSKINNTEQLSRVLGTCRKLNIPLLPPDVNISEQKFSTDGQSGIRFGFMSMRGIKKAASGIIKEREENGVFSDLNDFLLRTNSGKGIMQSLVKSGAFDRYETVSRKELLETLEDRIGYVKKILRAQKNAEKLLEEAKTAENKKTIRNRAQRALDAAENAKASLLSIQNLHITADKYEELKDEKEVLGVYVTGHPMDAYASVYKEIKRISDFETGSGKYAGIITDLQIRSRKKDGAKMAFFTLDEPTGQVKVNCFVNEYKEYQNLIKEDSAVIVEGKGSVEQNDEYDIWELTARKIKPCIKDLPYLFISAVSGFEKYKNPEGNPAYIHNPQTGEIKECHYRLDLKVLQDKEMYVQWLDYDIPKNMLFGEEVSSKFIEGIADR